MANKIVTDEVKKLIGTESQPLTFEIERGAIRRFAEAIGDPNPLFNDEQAARRTRFGGMIAPPTFMRSLGIEFLEVKVPANRALDGARRALFTRLVVAEPKQQTEVFTY